jgi:putative tricarboxylic transport membrane protein
MRALNRDSIVATVLLIAGGVLFWDTFQWRRTPYATMASSVWPRFVLIIFFALCAVYLVRSLVKGAAGESKATFLGWLTYYRNPLWCYGLFFLFLVTLPYLGILIGGILFVWAVQAVVGERTVRAQLRHATIAIASVGFMWLVFTYALDVILPAGSLFHI